MGRSCGRGSLLACRSRLQQIRVARRSSTIRWNKSIQWRGSRRVCSLGSYQLLLRFKKKSKNRKKSVAAPPARRPRGRTRCRRPITNMSVGSITALQTDSELNWILFITLVDVLLHLCDCDDEAYLLLQRVEARSSGGDVAACSARRRDLQKRLFRLLSRCWPFRIFWLYILLYVMNS